MVIIYHCVLMERMALSLILPVANDFLPLPSGQICPDIRTVCPDGDLGALRAALARPSSSRFLVRVDRRACDGGEGLIPLAAALAGACRQLARGRVPGYRVIGGAQRPLGA